jgi:hypothetical protein
VNSINSTPSTLFFPKVSTLMSAPAQIIDDSAQNSSELKISEVKRIESGLEAKLRA